MKISDQISMCLNNLLHRKMRTILTVTGVMVGACLVVIVVSLGIAMSAQQEAVLQSMGDLTRITIYNYGSSSNGEQIALDDDVVAAIAKIPGVDVATPIYQPRNLAAFIYGGKEERYSMRLDWNVTGMYAEAFPKMGFELLEGTWPEYQPNQKKPISILVGEYAAFNFEDTKRKEDDQRRYRWAEINEDGEVINTPFVNFNKDDLILHTEKMEEDSPDSTVVTREIKVAGRIKKDYNKGWETDQGIYMDIGDLKALESAYMKANKIKADSSRNQSGYNQVRVYVHSIDDVDSVDAAIKDMGFETESLESIRKPMQDSVKQQQLFLGMLGGVSLLVAAIGITNTMFMSIYERTREIGVMKVLGCKVANIRSVFLMEAGAIGFLGGIAGVLLSLAASAIINYFKLSFSGGNQNNVYMYGGFGRGGGSVDPSAMPVSVIPLWLVGAAIVFATLVGLLSGVMPANRAMKISALEAIKHE